MILTSRGLVLKYREALSHKGDRPDKQVRKKLVAVSLFAQVFSARMPLISQFFLFLPPKPLIICWQFGLKAVGSVVRQLVAS